MTFRADVRIGDRARFDSWTLDRFGALLPATYRQHRWTVIGTDTTVAGATGVTALLDSIVADTSGTRVDTLYFQLGSDGTVRQYGFLADVARQLFGRTLPRRWDVLAPFGAGSGQSFTAGFIDSAGLVPVAGTIDPDPDYFTIPIDGQPTILPAYQVDYAGPGVSCSLWLLDSPWTLPRFILDTATDSTGAYRIITGIQRAPRP
jgi:hypothetical protein